MLKPLCTALLLATLLGGPGLAADEHERGERGDRGERGEHRDRGHRKDWKAEERRGRDEWRDQERAERRYWREREREEHHPYRYEHEERGRGHRPPPWMDSYWRPGEARRFVALVPGDPSRMYVFRDGRWVLRRVLNPRARLDLEGAFRLPMAVPPMAPPSLGVDLHVVLFN